MALRLSGTAYLLDSTTFMSYNQTYTAAGWVLPKNLDAGSFRTIFTIANNSTGEQDSVSFQDNHLEMEQWADGNYSFSPVGTTALSVDTWYHIAIVRGGFPDGTLTIYLNGSVELTDIVGINSRGAPDRMVFGAWRDLGSQLDARLFGWKLWSAALSPAELVAESKTVLPRRTANLFDAYPFIEVGRYEGIYGHRGLSNNGIITREANVPSVAWGRDVIWVPIRAGTSNKTVAVGGSVTPIGSPSKQVSKSFVGLSTPSGAFAQLRLKLIALIGSCVPQGDAIAFTVGQNSTIGTCTPSGTVSLLKVGTTKLVSLVANCVPNGFITQRTVGKKLLGNSAPSGTLSASKIVTQLVSIAGSVTASGAVNIAKFTRLAGEGFLTWLRHRKRS